LPLAIGALDQQDATAAGAGLEHPRLGQHLRRQQHRLGAADVVLEPLGIGAAHQAGELRLRGDDIRLRLASLLVRLLRPRGERRGHRGNGTSQGEARGMTEHGHQHFDLLLLGE
jgi:hypothetical protein